MRRMIELTPTGIKGVQVAQSLAIEDERGFFARTFCAREFSDILQGKEIKQINHSLTVDVGIVRGMHYQNPPHAELKIVKCIRGRILDVAVDIRQGSETFLHYHAEELTPESKKMLIVPEGFAHGFQALEENSEIIYFNTAFYSSEYEAGFRPNDPALNIKWPLPISSMSPRDMSHALITDDFAGINL